ncbi:uncharacterized protein LOC142575690 isoform X1 [Dermacentor variabilis]|uniref:uncharacterized protein LOC142575690 isoform X1 n=1 Tax=Dermacentor variabilis TaxID=34621 RepID=UPI003F5C3D73
MQQQVLQSLYSRFDGLFSPAAVATKSSNVGQSGWRPCFPLHLLSLRRRLFYRRFRRLPTIAAMPVSVRARLGVPQSVWDLCVPASVSRLQLGLLLPSDLRCLLPDLRPVFLLLRRYWKEVTALACNALST